jgi:hypothetical protein
MASLRLASCRFYSGAFRKSHHRACLGRNLNTASSRRSPAGIALYTTAFTISAGLLMVYYLDSRSAIHRYILTPLLRYTVDAETSHKFAVKLLQSRLGPRDQLPDDERLKLKANNYHSVVTLFFKLPSISRSGIMKYLTPSDWQLDSTRTEKQLMVRPSNHLTP